jgi:hypothetical protein
MRQMPETVKTMWMRPALIALFGLAAICDASAQEFQIVKVPSAVAAPIKDLKPKTIFFSDHRNADGSGGFVKFEDWGRTIPIEKQFLSLYPAFTEAMVTRAVDGVTKTYKDKLQVYVAEARFSIDKPASAIDLSKYANIEFMEKLDPQIKHQVIKPGDFLYSKDERNINNENPDREWCEGKTVALCLRSRYQLEGKIPMGIALANKLRDNEKRLANYVEYENELRLLGPTDIDEPGLRKLTGVDAPVTAVLEQNIFAVNQIMRFGKFIIVLQQNPENPNDGIVSALLSLAVSSSTLEMKKSYEDMPVLRNLVPSQVLMGNSSFNTGTSISSGLPNYARNRITAIAEILNK